MFSLPGIAIGAIFAAIIASFFSFLGLIIAKEHKTSEFRQAWIDSLRREISQLIASANAIHAYSVIQKFSSVNDAWKAAKDDLVAINEATSNIRLRLNPEEPLSREVLNRIEEIEKMLAPGKYSGHDELNNKEKELVSDASKLLKSEWKRVKKGEPLYRMAILGVIFGMLVLIAVILFSFWQGQKEIENNNNIQGNVKSQNEWCGQNGACIVANSAATKIHLS